MAAEPTIAERIQKQDPRIHISIGAAMTPERVRWILDAQREAEEVFVPRDEIVRKVLADAD